MYPSLMVSLFPKKHMLLLPLSRFLPGLSPAQVKQQTKSTLAKAIITAHVSASSLSSWLGVSSLHFTLPAQQAGRAFLSLVDESLAVIVVAGQGPLLRRSRGGSCKEAWTLLLSCCGSLPRQCPGHVCIPHQIVMYVYAQQHRHGPWAAPMPAPLSKQQQRRSRPRLA